MPSNRVNASRSSNEHASEGRPSGGEAPNAQGQARAVSNQANDMLSTDAFAGVDQFFFADLGELNGSGVSGTALIGLDVDTGRITVAIQAAGLEPNQVHIQHIHGFGDGADAAIPTLDDDTDGDGFIELAEGAPVYGGILLDLQANHDNNVGGDNGHSHSGGLTGFPTAPEGLISFLESYQLPDGSALTEFDLTLNHIVIHGLTPPAGVGAGTPGEVDGSGDYAVVLPVAIGDIEAIETVKEFKSLFDQEDGGGHYSMFM